MLIAAADSFPIDYGTVIIQDQSVPEHEPFSCTRDDLIRGCIFVDGFIQLKTMLLYATAKIQIFSGEYEPQPKYEWVIQIHRKTQSQKSNGKPFRCLNRRTACDTPLPSGFTF